MILIIYIYIYILIYSSKFVRFKEMKWATATWPPPMLQSLGQWKELLGQILNTKELIDQTFHIVTFPLSIHIRPCFGWQVRNSNPPVKCDNVIGVKSSKR